VGTAALKALRRLTKDERRRPPKAKEAIREDPPEAFSPGKNEDSRWTPIPPEEWDEYQRWAVAVAFGEDYLRERLKGTKRKEGKR